jgi:hypothetical protein
MSQCACLPVYIWRISDYAYFGRVFGILFRDVETVHSTLSRLCPALGKAGCAMVRAFDCYGEGRVCYGESI